MKRIISIGLTLLFIALLKPVFAQTTFFDSSSNTLTIPQINFDGNYTFYNAELQLDADGYFSLISLESIPPDNSWEDKVPGAYFSDSGMIYTFFEDGTGSIKCSEDGSKESVLCNIDNLTYWVIDISGNLSFGVITSDGTHHKFTWEISNYNGDEGTIEILSKRRATYVDRDDGIITNILEYPPASEVLGEIE